jgi:hypothetical protein
MNHEFTLRLAGELEMTVEIADALFEAGCDDASAWSEGTTGYLTFHRDAESLGKAIGSAVDDVGRAGFTIAHITVGDLP